MPPRSSTLVPALLGLFARYEERRAQVDAVEAALAPLRARGGLVVEGEALYARQLQRTLDQARATFEALVQAPAEVDAARLAALSETLDAPIWQVVEPVLGWLLEKRARQDALKKTLEDTLRQIRSSQSTARAAIETARAARAPLVREVAWLRAAESLLAQASGALDGHDLVRVAQLQAQLDADEADADELVAAVRDKLERARPLSRQAELVILRSAGDAQGQLRYTVMLRAHGANIQGASTIVRQDRERLDALITRLGAHVGARPVEVLSARDGTRSMLPRPPEGAPIGDGPIDGLARELGKLLFLLLLPPPMQRYLADNRSSVSITTNDLELPWELMYLQDFVCLDRPVARMPIGNTPQRPPPAEQPELEPKIRFALVYSDPTGNLPGARREVEQIQKDLGALSDQVEIEVFAADRASGGELNRALVDGGYDVIHYAGHAWFDELDPQRSGLVLADEEVFSAEKIHRLNQGRPLVFLNACSSARTRNEDGVYDQLPAGGLAAAFIYGGALACIGSVWPVPDRPAAAFATAFYRYVLDGHMIGEALRMARHEIRKQDPGDPTWAGFVLYGDPRFTLVE